MGIHHIGGLILAKKNEEAVAEITQAYKTARASQEDAAKLLGVATSTFARWVVRLKIGHLLLEIEAEAKRGGWHHGRVGGLTPELWKKRKARAARRMGTRTGTQAGRRVR